jgi:aspartate racemase
MPAIHSSRLCLFPQRKIGVIVGPNPLSALVYNEIVYRELGRRQPTLNATWLFSHCFVEPALHPDCFDDSVEMEHRVDLAADALAGTELAEVLMAAAPFGAFSNRIERRLGVPVCDLFTVTARAVKQFDLFPAGVIGAVSSLEFNLWSRRLRESGGETICPSDLEQAQVERLMNENTQIDIARAGLVRAVASLRQSGARSVILCAPRTRRILREEDSLLPLICAAEQQVKAAVNRAFDAIEADV